MTTLSRRSILAGRGAGSLAGFAAPGPGRAADAASRTAWDFAFPSIEGGTLDLASLRGRALLVANTASFCGYTPPLRGLGAL